MKEINILKPIELTPEQKKELIHLCNKTWLELIFFLYANQNYIGCKNKQTNIFIHPIHWFEFVVRMAIDEERDEFMNFYLNVCSPDETSNT